MLNNNGSSRTDTLIKLVLVFFLSLLSFSVGTFVGKQFSDSQHRIADLEGEGQEDSRSTASIPENTNKAEPANAISEEEINKLSEEFVHKEKLEGKEITDTATAKGGDENHGEKSKNSRKKETASAHSASIKDEISQISRKIAAGEKLEAPKAPTNPIPKILPRELASSSVGKYTVQLAAFPQEDEAKTKTEELKNKGLSAQYYEAALGGKTWYRVSVGKFGTAREAKEALGDIKKKAEAKDAIVKIIGQ